MRWTMSATLDAYVQSLPGRQNAERLRAISVGAPPVTSSKRRGRRMYGPTRLRRQLYSFAPSRQRW
jgi:hypothetical protein